MNIRILIFLLAPLGALAAAEEGHAQERAITLVEALSEARRASHDVRAARSRAEAARYAEEAAGAFLLPTLGLEAGAVRSNDPVAAFGGRLRQGRFTEEDFDPARLNHPDALTDWSGAVGAAWAPLDPAALSGRSASRADAAAAALGASWVERAAAFQAEVRYMEAVGADRRLAAAAAALAAAEEVARLVQLRRGEGLLTDADLLQARAARDAARAGRIDALRAVGDARDRLAVSLAWPDGATPVPTDTAFADEVSLGEGDVASRADLRASALSVDAAGARAAQAHRTRLPRLEGFARIETHSTRAFTGTEHDWTVGVRVSIPLFSGFALSSRARAAAALHEAAGREHEARLRQAASDLAQARRAVEAARQGSLAAHAAAVAASEAARLMRRRFEEGLTTTADLLGAEAQVADFRARAIQARLGLQMLVARLAFLTDTTTDHVPGGTER
jgi:outer membrane protein TolC